MTGDDDRAVSRRAILRSAGLVGTVGGAGSVAAQTGSDTRPVFPEYVRDARGGRYADLRGESSVTVAVGAGETGFAYDPAFVWVDPGTTVTFEWVSDDHNVVHWSRPAGSDWRGTGPTIYDAGHTHSHAFEVPGTYTYYCQPHDQLRMKGAVAVGPDVPTTERPLADDPDTVLGVRLPSTPLQWGVAAVATVGATTLGTASAWLWWTSGTADAYPGPDAGFDAGQAPGDGDGRADEALATGDERAETARRAVADGEFRRAVARWEDALAAYERALRAVDGGGREREVRDRVETAEEALAAARERRDGARDLDRRLETAVEHRERAERALADGDDDAALAALDRATDALDRAADLDAEHDLAAGQRVAAEREVVASLRERCEER